ncbi:MAG: TRAP transporter substrate-binding protein [Proteobacteria bacterium]|nr:TRAP transporter substrate-binding protein [Pseudomonadota bacterium]
MAKEVEKRVPGRVEWQLFPGGRLGNDATMITGMRTGTHVANMTGSWVPNLVPAFNLFEAPFFFSNRDDVKKVIRAVFPDLYKGLEEKGIILTGLGELGFRQISNNVRPIVRPDDLKGIKLRVPGTPFRMTTFKLFGANPTPMSAAELYTSLRQGVVDGQENPLASIWGFKFHEVQKYISMTNHVFTPTIVMFSKVHWDGWAPEIRKAIQEASDAAVEFSYKWLEGKDQSLRAEMMKANPELKFNDIDSAAFRKAAAPLYDELEKMVGKDV